MKPASPSGENYADIEQSVVEVFVRLAQMISLPKSVGEIYGLLFISPAPLALDHLVERLGISKGSASQGLRHLLSLGAIKRVYVRGDRRDHFEAEVALRKIARGFLKEHINPELEKTEFIIRQLDRDAGRLAPAERKAVRERLTRLEGWHRNGRKLLPLVVQFLKA